MQKSFWAFDAPLGSRIGVTVFFHTSSMRLSNNSNPSFSCSGLLLHPQRFWVLSLNLCCPALTPSHADIRHWTILQQNTFSLATKWLFHCSTTWHYHRHRHEISIIIIIIITKLQQREWAELVAELEDSNVYYLLLLRRMISTFFATRYPMVIIRM